MPCLLLHLAMLQFSKYIYADDSFGKNVRKDEVEISMQILDGNILFISTIVQAYASVLLPLYK